MNVKAFKNKYFQYRIQLTVIVDVSATYDGPSKIRKAMRINHKQQITHLAFRYLNPRNT